MREALLLAVMACLFVVTESFVVKPIIPWHPHRAVTCQHAVTPVGPFCPFRSPASVDLDPQMDALLEDADVSVELQRIQVELASGISPDPQRVLETAEHLERAIAHWETATTKMKGSPDFQNQEYATLVATHKAAFNLTDETTARLMKWQASCLRSMGQNQPPPPPPPDLDLAKIVEIHSNPNIPNSEAMNKALAITAQPFPPEEVFESETVEQEYKALCRDHDSLIQFGKSYGDFDRVGKLTYLDQIQAIQDRWDVFFARFQLMGSLNPSYIQQCNDFLRALGLTEQDYRDLLKRTHDQMRERAERDL